MYIYNLFIYLYSSYNFYLRVEQQVNPSTSQRLTSSTPHTTQTSYNSSPHTPGRGGARMGTPSPATIRPQTPIRRPVLSSPGIFIHIFSNILFGIYKWFLISNGRTIIKSWESSVLL